MYLHEIFEGIVASRLQEEADDLFINFSTVLETLVSEAKIEKISKIPMDLFLDLVKNTGISINYDIFVELMTQHPNLNSFIKNYNQDEIELDIGQVDVPEIKDEETSRKAVEKIAKRVAKRRLKKK